MTVMWKFELNPIAVGIVQQLDMPKGAIVRWFGSPTFGWGRIWAEVDAVQQLEMRSFVIVETGREIPAGAQYIGTAHMEPIAWHLFEVKS